MLIAHIAGIPVEETAALLVAGGGTGATTLVFLFRKRLARLFSRQRSEDPGGPRE